MRRVRDAVILGLGAGLGGIYADEGRPHLLGFALGIVGAVIILLADWLLGRDWRLRRWES